MDCKSVEEKLALCFYEELAPEERAAVEAHLGSCARCADAAAELRRLRATLDARPGREPSPELLVRCRWDLDAALDREDESWRGLVRSWLGLSRGRAALRLTTALSVLLVGVSLGWTLHRQSARPVPGDSGPASPWVGADLANLRINAISQVAPNPQTGAVRITLDAQRRVTLEGSLDDPRIRQVLLSTMRDYSNPGIRLDTLDALRARSDNPEVRAALLYAMRNDANAGVRLEALEAVGEMGWSPEVRQGLLETLRHETNPGVRVAAINVLVEHADEDVLPVFEELAVNDPNPYVRLQCQNAVRELKREKF